MNERQRSYLTDWHEAHGVELPDLGTEEGQSEAWSNMRAWWDEAQDQQPALQAPSAVDDSLLPYFTAAQIKEAEERRRKAEAKEAKEKGRTEKELAAGEIHEACRAVWRSSKWVSDQLANVLETEGEAADGARAWAEWSREPARLKRATEEGLAHVLEAINAAAPRLGADPGTRPMTVSEAEDEHERTRTRTPEEERAEKRAAWDRQDAAWEREQEEHARIRQRQQQDREERERQRSQQAAMQQPPATAPRQADRQQDRRDTQLRTRTPGPRGQER